MHNEPKPGDHRAIIDTEVFWWNIETGTTCFGHGVDHVTKPGVAGDATAEEQLIFLSVRHSTFGDLG